MVMLPITHPTIDRVFKKGLFCIQGGSTEFSLMAMDQNIEHFIKFIKSAGGLRGLYGNQEERDIVEISRPVILNGLKNLNKKN